MNKKKSVLLSLLIFYQLTVYGKVLLTDPEIEILNDIEMLAPAKDIILCLNLPLIGEIELQQNFDSRKGSFDFINENPIDLNLMPIPLLLERLHIFEQRGNLELKARATLFSRAAQVSLSGLKRINDIKIIETSTSTKLLIDISEMTLALKFNELSIKLLSDINLNLDSASVILRKNKQSKFIAHSKIFDNSVEFNFAFLPEGQALIKYSIINDIKLPNLFENLEFDYNGITLKNISLMNQYPTDSLFSKSSHYTIRGNAFADLKINDKSLPINLIDLPAIFKYADDKYQIKISLPEFDLPLFGTISKGYVTIANSLKLVGHGLLNLPYLGIHSYELEAINHQGRTLFRGKFDHSIKYENLIIESPKYIFNPTNNALKIYGKSTVYDIKCLVELAFTNFGFSRITRPDLKVSTLQKVWKPFNDSSNEGLSAIELRLPQLVMVDNDGHLDVNIMGKMRWLNEEVDAQINHLKSASGLTSVLKIKPTESCWKVSDSFDHVKQFDDLQIKPQFIIADKVFFDPRMHMYFNKGINFFGKLLLNEKLNLMSNLIPVGDVLIYGTVSDDFKNFIWQAPLTSGLTTKAKIITIGPLNLELNSHAPLSINSTISLSTPDSNSLNFSGAFRLSQNRLIFNSVSSQSWNNMFEIPGLSMVNPKLEVTLDNDHFGVHSLPDSIVISGDINFGSNKMPGTSLINENFSEFSLVGHAEHFWLNELADHIISNKQIYSILPPLEIKNIAFNISANHGFQLEGTLNIFGSQVTVQCEAKKDNLIIHAVLPKLVSSGIEILGTNCKPGPTLLLEVKGDENLSNLQGRMRIGNLIELNDPIMITAQGCDFQSHTTLGSHKFGIKITGKSSGFIIAPQFELTINFKNDGLNYFKNAIARELTAHDIVLQREIANVINDIKLLENNLDSLEDLEQHRLASVALNENKNKVNNWEQAGLIKLNDEGIYTSSELDKKFELIEIKFSGPADRIQGSVIPLIYTLSISGETRELRFMTDFSHLAQSVKELAKEIIDIGLEKSL